MRAYKQNKMKLLAGLFSLVLAFGSFQSIGQCHPNLDCANATVINPAVDGFFQTHDCACPSSNSESWFVIDIGTTTYQFVMFPTTGSAVAHVDYEVYGPFETTYSCTDTIPANLLEQGSNFSMFVSGGSIGVSEQNGISVDLIPGIGGGNTYYIVKVVDVDDALDCFEITTRFAVPPLAIPIAASTTITHTSTYITTVPNTLCDFAAQACDLNFSHDCSSSLSGSFLWYVLDVQSAGATVTIDVFDNVGGTPANFSYILADQTVTDPCVPFGGTDILDNQSGTTSMSYTFASPGQYVVVLYDLPACPKVIIDQSPDCSTASPCPTYSGAFNCDNALDICEDLNDTISCSCGVPLDFWYTFDVQNPGQGIDFDVSSLGGGIQNFSWQLYGPMPGPGAYICDASGLAAYELDGAIGVTSGTQTFMATGEYFLVITPTADCPIINIDFTPDAPCVLDPCPPYAGSFSCDDALDICDDLNDTINCSCGVPQQFWYTFDVLNTAQTINVDVGTNFGGAAQTFNWAIIGPMPTTYTCDAAGLTPYTLLAQNGITNGAYSFPVTGEYFLVVTPSADCPIINIDFNLNCGEIPCPAVEIRSCATLNDNLIVNGDFGLGNYGFTSDYANRTVLGPSGFPGSYKVGTHYAIQDYTDDHTANGIMMSVDGAATAGLDVWCQTVSVIPNTDYEFSAWVLATTALSATVDIPELQLFINGSPVGGTFSPTNTSAIWVDNMIRTWNSGTSSTATICIQNAHLSIPGVEGNNFALDDISFTQLDVECCANELLNFFVTAAAGSGGINSVSWDFGDGSLPSATGSHSYTTPGVYTVTVTVIFNDGCLSTNSEVIEIVDCCPTLEILGCSSAANNLVFNGDFELGNQPETVTMINSDLQYQPNNSINPGEGSYIIDNAPIGLLSPSGLFVNHTPGAGATGYVMFAHDDLANPTDIAWEKTLTALNPNTDYHFEAWFTPTTNLTFSGTDNINLYVNGGLIGAVNRVGLTPGTWYKVEGTWNSGTSTSALFQIELENNSLADDGRTLIDDVSVIELNCELCADEEIEFTFGTGGDLTGATIEWNFGDGSPISASGIHTYNTPGMYTIALTVTFANGCHATVSQVVDIIDCEPLPCESCIGSFAPIPGGKYLFGAWAMEEGAPPTKTSYNFPEVYIDLTLSATAGGGTIVKGPFSPQGVIIDGWQRIEDTLSIHPDAIDITIRLTSTNGNVFYDDIRFFPFDASMKSYVYDPLNMRLAAELDERHYATFYEYNELGQLTRIKKETEKGVMTIQETKNNSSKK